jgi:putative ABC transport system ATP-binding protein
VDLAAVDDDRRTLLRRRRIGLVFQDFNLIDVLTAEENVALPLAIDGRPPAEASRRARRALEAVGLAHRRSHRPGQLSGGEQQRTALARALVVEPLVLLADEPTANLDSACARQVLDLMRGLADGRGLTVVMATHDVGQARRADRLVVLRDGLVAPSSAVVPAEAA